MKQHLALMAYSLLPLPDIDRVIVTNSSMRDEDRNGHTYQIFRLSDLKRLSTNDFDAPPGHYCEINPEEARRGPDGAVYVQTTGCGIERVTNIASDHPRSKLVWQFPVLEVALADLDGFIPRNSQGSA